MARKGRDISGWLVVDKPLNVSSTSVVAKARWIFQAQKAGHAGTLDPLATGILAVALGEATKTVPYVTDALKAYRFTVRWGQQTTTDGNLYCRSGRGNGSHRLLLRLKTQPLPLGRPLPRSLPADAARDSDRRRPPPPTVSR